MHRVRPQLGDSSCILRVLPKAHAYMHRVYRCPADLARAAFICGLCIRMVVMMAIMASID